MPDANEQVLRFCDHAAELGRMNDTRRFALYYAPPAGSPWARFGAEWFARIDEAPRRYGFHATLKAPFRLAEGQSLQGLLAELERYCAGRRAWPMPPLKIALLGNFLALIPAQTDPEIDAVAAECVIRFDRFRAPLEDRDLARRHPERLNAEELRMLRRWGYPYVLDLFRFHLSLTGPLGDTNQRRAAELTVEAGKALGALGSPAFDAICVFEEPQAGADFHLVQRVPFAS